MPAGRARKGVIEGDTARHVRKLLRERQLLPVTVEEVAAQESRRQARRRLQLRPRRVSAADLALLTRQLATLVRAGAAARGGAARGLAADREAARAEHPARRARQGGRGPHARRRAWPSSRAYSRRSIAPRSRPASSPGISMRCSSASPTTPRSREQMRAEGPGRAALPDRADGHVLHASCRILLAYVVPKVVEVFRGATTPSCRSRPAC